MDAQQRQREARHEAANEALTFEEVGDEIVCRHLGKVPPEHRAMVRARLSAIARDLRTLPPKDIPQRLTNEERADVARKLGVASESAGLAMIESLCAQTLVDRWRTSAARRLKPQMEKPARRERAFRWLDKLMWNYLTRENGETYAPRITGPTGKLKRRVFNDEMLHALAVEWLRDKDELRAFFGECFDLWEEIDKDESVHRRRVLVHQLAEEYAHDFKRIMQHLQDVKAIPPDTELKPGEAEKWLQTLRQDASRDGREALAAWLKRHPRESARFAKSVNENAVTDQPSGDT